MIIPLLKGGLGNQMFTIAAGYSKSLDLNTEFCINYEFFPHYKGQGRNPKDLKDSFYSKIKETTYVPTNRFNEKDWSYAPIPDIDDMIVDGYFQSSKHFANNRDKIKQLFVFPDNIKTKIDKTLNNINKKKLGIHVRLGDYLQPGYFTTHFVCDRNYYINALKQFNLEEYTILVCSDSFNDYKKYINLENAIYVNSKSELEDMYLLSQCDSIILSNSSFSFWSYFLGKEKEKTCAPNKWFGVDGPKNYQDIYENDWIKIEL